MVIFFSDVSNETGENKDVLIFYIFLLTGYIKNMQKVAHIFSCIWWNRWSKAVDLFFMTKNSARLLKIVGLSTTIKHLPKG